MKPNNKSIIWVGSHNFTQSALLDQNIEASVIIETTQESDFYKQQMRFLLDIKQQCVKYSPITAKWLHILQGKNLERFGKQEIAELYDLDPRLIDYFFRTQVIYIIGEEVDSLHISRNLIQVIGLDKQFSQPLSIKNKKIILYIQDSLSGHYHIYLASVLLTGDIDEQIEDSYKMTFSSRRYVVLERNLLGAFLDKKTEITEKHLKGVNYVSSLKIEQKIEQLNIYPYPSNAWVTIDNPSNLRSLTLQEKELLLKKRMEQEDQKDNLLDIPKKERAVKIKRIDANIDVLSKADNELLPVLDSYEADDLVYYYEKRLNVLEKRGQTELNFSYDGYLEGFYPLEAKHKQSNYGKVVVVMLGEGE